MGNIKIPYGFNTIEGTELRSVKLRISLNRIVCGSYDDHRRRNTVCMVKYYGQLKQVSLDAGLKFQDDDKFVRIEGITTSTKFYLRYKAIMSNVDAYTAKLEVEYWESLLSEAIHSSDDSDTSKFDWADYESGPKIVESEPDSSESGLEFVDDDAVYLRQTQPDADGRYTMTWRLRDGSIHQTRHNLYE